MKYVEFCGAFNGKIKLRDGESEKEALHRAEVLMQNALDRAKTLKNLGVGVDYGDFKLVNENGEEI